LEAIVSQSSPVPKSPLKTIAKRVIDAMVEDKDGDDFLDDGAQLHEHPEWQSLDDISLIIRVSEC